MSKQISCVNKIDRENPHERITHIGGTHNWIKWRITQAEGVRLTEEAKRYGLVAFHVGSGNDKVDVIVKVSAAGHKYLTTEPDGETQNNLLSLSECSL
jgi:hypothetical protein